MRKIALLCAVLILFAAVPSFAFRERVVRYYGYYYGHPDDVDFCNCQISPCAPDQIGEQGFFCNEMYNYQWGKVEGICFTSIEVDYYDWCEAQP